MPRVKIDKPDTLLRHYSTSSTEEMSMEHKIAVMNTRQAADYLRNRGLGTSPETIRKGIEQGVFPFGDAIKTERSTVYYIYRKLLDKWIQERTV